ncbi:MAG: O-antigen polymerase [Clostridium perfringens]|nr:O-antigen polymerase [Clostridium perfringens]
MNTGLSFSQYDGEAILRIPFWFILLSGIFIGVIFSREKNKLDFIGSLIIILIIYTCIQMFFIDDIVKYFNFIFLYFGIYFLYYIIKNIKLDIDDILKFVNFIAIYNSILSIAQYFTGIKLLPGVWFDSIYFLEGANSVKRVVGVVGSNNAAGNFGAILFVVILYNAVKRRRVIDFLALGLTSIFSIITLTRIGYLAIGVSIIIFYFFTNWSNKKIFIFKYILLLFGIMLGGIILFKFGYLIYETLFIKRGHTSDYRFTQFTFVLNYLLPNNYLLGVGAGQMNNYIYNNYYYYELDLHSQYLNVLIEQGIFMFINFIVLNVSIFIKMIKRFKNYNLERIFIISLFISNLICSNYNPNQYYLSNNVLYYLIVFVIAFGGYPKFINRER